MDGQYDQGEWSDATCVTVASDPVYLKYSGTNLYLAWAMTPVNPGWGYVAVSSDGAASLDGQQLMLGIYNDPNGPNGDASELISVAGAWQMTSQSGTPGIVVENPPGMPALVTYELAIPLSKLGIIPGQAKSIGLTVLNPIDCFGPPINLESWPTGMGSQGCQDVTGMGQMPSALFDPATWGTLSSSANWQ